MRAKQILLATIVLIAMLSSVSAQDQDISQADIFSEDGILSTMHQVND